MGDHLLNNEHSFIGIEIEICIDEDFYKSLQSDMEPSVTKNYTMCYKYPPKKDGTPYYPFGEGELTDIILDKDISCICEPTYTSAEIISPKMNRDKIPFFFDFLKNTLMKDKTKIYQGKTCGIHIHWSNTEISTNYNSIADPVKKANYIFEFLKILTHLRNHIGPEIINTPFSGRYENYLEFEPTISIDLLYNFKYKDIANKNKIIENIKFTIDINNDTDLNSLYTLFIGTGVNIFDTTDFLAKDIETRITYYLDELVIGDLIKLYNLTHKFFSLLHTPLPPLSMDNPNKEYKEYIKTIIKISILKWDNDDENFNLIKDRIDKTLKGDLSKFNNNIKVLKLAKWGFMRDNILSNADIEFKKKYLMLKL